MNPTEVPLEHLPEVDQQVPPFCYLNGVGCSLCGALGVVGTAIPSDDVDAWVLHEPGCEGFAGPVGENVDDLVRFEIHQDRAVGDAFADRPVINSEDPWGREYGEPGAPDKPEDGVGTAWHCQVIEEPSIGFPTKGDTNSALADGEAIGSPGKPIHEAWERLGEGSSGAVGVTAVQAPDLKAEPDGSAAGWEVLGRATIVAVESFAGLAASEAFAGTRLALGGDGYRRFLGVDALDRAAWEGMELSHGSW